jgi:hypothetical protein
MKNLLSLTSFLLLVQMELSSQGSNIRYQIPEAIYSRAYRVEVLKSGEDCAVISYVPMEYNETITPRDDRNFGAQYMVSGRDCNKLFAQTFDGFKGWEEEDYAPIPSATLVLDSFAFINTTTTDEVIADGCTKVFITSFWSDQGITKERSRNVYLGTDVFIESADPASIEGPFDLSVISPETKDLPAMIDYLSKNDYYKLREMQVNKNLIVEKLRTDGKLKDITPVVKTEKLKVRRVKMVN